MDKRVALLRGINVGRANRVAMAELRELATELGLTDVATHLQSGNLIYGSAATPAEDQTLLTAALTERFGFEIPVVVTDRETVTRVLAEHPFADDDPKSVHVGFASGPLPDTLLDDLVALAREWERFEVRGDVLFADFGGRVHDSRVANKLARLVSPGFITLRNLTTVRAIAEKLG
ncbi:MULTISPECIES: DUF1697 domain-containing protein [unclassified Luteococcus]|uniref:DUF1697 domain-containing protein n=1 Tax=unclassified Luteococcus TaxID=2639923 RepID=UPI00313D40D5